MYRTIDAKFWTDPKIKSLGTAGKLLALYLVTNPHSHVSGIYYLPENIITLETGLQRKGIDTLWDTLSSSGFARRDKKNEVVWVVKMLFYQGNYEKCHRAAASNLSNLHNSPLINEFLSAYPQIKKWVKDTLPIWYPAQERCGAQEQEQEQEQEQNTPLPPKAKIAESKNDPITDLAIEATFLQGQGGRPAAVSGWRVVLADLVNIKKIPIADLVKELKREDRERSEKDWQFKKRFEKPAPALNGHHQKTETSAERAARQTAAIVRGIEEDEAKR